MQLPFTSKNARNERHIQCEPLCLPEMPFTCVLFLHEFILFAYFIYLCSDLVQLCNVSRVNMYCKLNCRCLSVIIVCNGGVVAQGRGTSQRTTASSTGTEPGVGGAAETGAAAAAGHPEVKKQACVRVWCTCLCARVCVVCVGGWGVGVSLHRSQSRTVTCVCVLCVCVCVCVCVCGQFTSKPIKDCDFHFHT